MTSHFDHFRQLHKTARDPSGLVLGEIGLPPTSDAPVVAGIAEREALAACVLDPIGVAVAVDCPREGNAARLHAFLRTERERFDKGVAKPPNKKSDRLPGAGCAVHVKPTPNVV